MTTWFPQKMFEDEMALKGNVAATAGLHCHMKRVNANFFDGK